VSDRLISFLFIGILLALGYHLAEQLIYEHVFPNSRFFVAYWYVPLVIMPALLLAATAWLIGYFRRGGRRGEDAIALLVLCLIVVCTVGAPYSCWNGCF
jgi:uncharacterized protein YacL